MRLLFRLLRAHLSLAQTIGFSLAGVVGMTIVLTAVQIYRDVLPVLDSPDTFMSGDYLVLSRKVGTLQTFGLGGNDFSPQELENLKDQEFVSSAGAFVSADYQVMGTFGFGGISFSTYLFFESVPDRFLDVETNEWRFEAGDREIPIIIPRNYLNLYNFGFARSQGLPQISESLFRRVGFDIEIRGNGLREQFRGRIVGLSNRLNTILVPESFILWSNERFGKNSGETRPSRIIVETNRPIDGAIKQFLAQNGYEVEGDLRESGKEVQLLQMATSGVGAVGLAFSAMAFYVLMLSIFLLLQKNSRKMEILLLLGYTPARVALPYQLLTLGLNGAVLIFSMLLLWLIRGYYLPELAELQEGYVAAGMGVTLLYGVVLALLLTLFNGIAISRKVVGIGKK